MLQEVDKSPAALVVAHPGHEVRVSGWCELARPRLFILTEGSRSGDHGRLLCAQSFANQNGATLGPLFGRFRDREIYAAILAGDQALIRWTADLTDALVALAPTLIVTDSWQMYNLGHDLTHVMARVAASRASAYLGRAIEVVEFEVAPKALACDRLWGAEAFRVVLDDTSLARKHTMAENYQDLREEFRQVLALEGPDAQRLEIFHSVVDFDALMPAPRTLIPYERYGEQRVVAGVYGEVIRWSEHVRGIVEAIRMMEPRPSACAS
jgi:hypothetical protein